MLMQTTKKTEIRNAILIGGMCAISYLAVYIARNMLTATSTQITAAGAFSESALGILSSVYFYTYACGQLINGFVGDRIKAKYMISFGLMLAGVCNAAFSFLADIPLAAYITYGTSGFFLSMIYGPMTKTVAENTNPVYATRVSVAYTFSSLIGTPIAGFVAVLVAWNTAFQVSASSLLIMGLVCLLCFSHLEKKGIIRYGVHQIPKQAAKKGNRIKTLVKRQIIKFTVISMITGVVRTAVVFWLPTYLNQRLAFDTDTATMIFSLCTTVIAFTSFIAVFTYEIMKRNMDLSILIYFILSAVGFLVLLFVKAPILNIIVLVFAIIACHCADSLMWSRYCPSLYDTGLTSTATGYLDFISYASAATASAIFPHLKDLIRWEGLILVWAGLMVIGVLVSLPRKQRKA